MCGVYTHVLLFIFICTTMYLYALPLALFICTFYMCVLIYMCFHLPVHGCKWAYIVYDSEDNVSFKF